MILGCGTAGLIYVFFQNGFQKTSVKSLVMALAYCWALTQAIYLMGHGLVAVPRRLILNANITARLRSLQMQASKVHDRLEDASAVMDDIVSEVDKLANDKPANSIEHQEWIQELAASAELHAHRMQTRTGARVPSTAPTLVITDRYLADLSRRICRARHEYIRFRDRWDRLIEQAIDLQAIVDAAASRKLEPKSSELSGPSSTHWNVLTPLQRYLIYSHVLPAIRLTAGILSGLASICIIWSEIIKPLAPQLSIVSLTVIHPQNSNTREIGLGGQVVAALWILYMCTTALASFDEIKVWGNRALVRRNTYGESACWYAGQIAKLTVPLAYNFVTFLPQSIRQKTVFFDFLGRLIILTPLGKGFDYFFPVFILVPVCATLFNLYGRVKSIFGYDVLNGYEEEDASGHGTAVWREGCDLIEREIHGRRDLELSSPGTRKWRPRPLGNQPLRSANARLSLSTRAVNPRQSNLPSNQSATVNQGSYPSSSASPEASNEQSITQFTHRVRNTFDAAERPKWLRPSLKWPEWIGNAGSKKWRTGLGEAGRGLGKWFGGRSADGRIEL